MININTRHVLSALLRVSFVLSIILFFNTESISQCGTPTSVQSQSGCPGTYTLRVISLNSTVTSIKWYIGPSGTSVITPTTNGSIGGTCQSEYTSSFSSTVTYWVALVCSGGTEGTRVPISFTNTAANLTISTSSDPMAVPYGGSVSLTASSSGGSYQWKWGNPSGATISDVTVSAAKGGTYYAFGTNNCSTSQSGSVNVNFVPLSDAGLNKTIPLTTTSCTFYGSGADQDGDPLTYLWTQQGGQAVSMPITNSPTLEATGFGVKGYYTFRLTVTDPYGKSNFDDVIVEVQILTNNTYSSTTEKRIIVSGVKDEISIPASSYSSIVYVDNLNKPIEGIESKASPLGKDVIKPIVYDELGRNAKTYLPVVYPQTNAVYQDVLNASGEYTGSVATFYTDKPYSVTEFEKSPLGRPIKQGSAGALWQPTQTSGYTQISYGNNDGTTGMPIVRVWALDTSTGLPFSSGVWMNNVLKVETITNLISDTKQSKSQAITNLQGLKLVQRTLEDGANAWAETYYMYDDRNNLKFIFPPALMKILRDAGNYIYSPTIDQIDSWCTQYLYDDLDRVIASKGPGSEWNSMVYDKLGRLILSQDGNQQIRNQWSFTKYDEFNRPVISGIFNPATVYTRNALQSIVNSLNNGKGYQHDTPPVGTTASSIRTGVDIISSAYDNYKEYQATNSISFKPGFSFAATSTNDFRGAIGDGGTLSDNVFPNENVDNLVITYYDNYLGNNSLFLDPAYQFTPETFTSTGGDPFLRFDRIKGQITGSSIRILNSNQWLHSVVYYDDQQRTIQIVTADHLGQMKKESLSYDFSGKVLESKRRQLSFLTIRRYAYDQTGRLLKVYHKLNNQPEVILTANVYNELGQVVDKNLYSTDLTSPVYLQSIDYAYNIKGWSIKVNSASGSDPGETDYFGYEIGYETDVFGAGISSATRKDGLITSAKWRNDFGTKQNLYAYNYDNLNRLSGANFKAGVNSAWTTDIDFYSEKNLTYDYNGNIQTLERSKQTGLGTSQIIDNLSYNYGTSSGNQLKKVTENSTVSLKDQGFKDGNLMNDDYAYDKNGNLIFDKNKDIKDIQYNVLDLPEKVTFVDNSYMKYGYDASGTKINQTLFNSNDQPQLKTDYVGEQVLIDDVPVVILHEEGRLLPPAYTNLIENREANGLSGFAALGTVDITSEYINAQTYVKAVSKQTTSSPGVFPIGGTFNVKAGESYSFKVLGYQSAGSTARFYVWTNVGDLSITNVFMPQGLANETWTTLNFTIPNGANQMRVGVIWTPPSLNNTLYINKVALYKTDWEYQYFLSDQVASPRVVLSTNPSTLKYNATFETENQSTESGTNGNYPLFFNVNPAKIIAHPSNITPGGNEVIALDNTYRIGPSRSLKVYPGDRIDASVSAYYAAMSGLTQATDAVLSNALMTVMTNANIAGFDAGIATAYNNSASGIEGFALSPNNGTTRPSAFLNLIYFDENYVPLQALSAAFGTTPNVSYPLSISFPVIPEVGYVFIYLSYDNENGGPVYFDEFNITHTESPMVQVNDYYPYGLTSYSWIREGEYENRFLYQGKELDPKTGLQDFHARQYDPSLGRWFATDPASQYSSPYLAMGNNPVLYTDPDGKWAGYDDLIVAAVGFVYGYVSYGIGHDDWGGKAVLNGGIQAAIFELGYLTGGAGLAVNAGASATASVTMNTAVSYLGATAINITAAQIIPSIPVYQSENFSLSLSPSISMQGMGINLYGSYSSDDFSVSAGLGAGSSGYSAGGAVGYKGFSYYYSHVGGGTDNAQSVGGIGVNKGDFSLRFENDFFAHSGDRWRTGGIEMGYRDFIFGTQIYTNDPGNMPGAREEKIDFEGTNLRGQKNTSRKGISYGAWKDGWVSDSPAYFGYKYGNAVIKAGINNPRVQDLTQNVIHRSIVKQNYYNNYTNYQGVYFQVANQNPFSIYNY